MSSRVVKKFNNKSERRRENFEMEWSLLSSFRVAQKLVTIEKSFQLPPFDLCALCWCFFLLPSYKEFNCRRSLHQHTINRRRDARRNRNFSPYFYCCLPFAKSRLFAFMPWRFIFWTGDFLLLVCKKNVHIHKHRGMK